MTHPNWIHGDFPARKNRPVPARQVGLFYFLWLGEHGRNGPYDISAIAAAHPDAGQHPDAPYWGGFGVYHHWGEPFYGYYFSDDEWVVRRHMKLLLQAGVDFLFFDTTNAVLYEKNAKLVMRVLEEYRADGWEIPKVMFYTNTASGQTAQALYEAIYKPGFCPGTWYRCEGKPVIVARPEECSPEVRDFFNIRLAQWPNEPGKAGGWPWMDFTRPQRIFPNVNGEPECINVSVAQHPQLRFGDSVLYGETGNRGRAYHDGANDPAPDAWKKGYNFREQFERALEADCPVTLATGWNEWIAGYWQGIPERPVMFVDCANHEYSRDIEMMRGGYFDAYYRLLCEYTAKLHGIGEETVLRVGDSCEFRGYPDGNFQRNHPGYGKCYENRSGRHAIRRIGIAHTGEHVEFTLHTAEPIALTDCGGTFLTLYLWSNGAELRYHPFSEGASVGQNAVTYRIPRSLLGQTVDFKAADSRDPIRSEEDFYDHGDVLPLGYHRYRIIPE